MDLKQYLKKAFRWEKGRQKSGYDKMLMLTSMWPMPIDMYCLKFPEGSHIPPHVDETTLGNHYRLNVVIKNTKEGGEFQCQNPIFETKRIKYFRPDVSEHSVSKVLGGNRYVLSIGWVLST